MVALLRSECSKATMLQSSRATWDTGFDHMFDRSSIRRLR